jgi:hypothetical protein
MNSSNQPKPQIEITDHGPCIVNGGLPLRERLIVTHGEGEFLDHAEGEK